MGINRTRRFGALGKSYLEVSMRLKKRPEVLEKKLSRYGLASWAVIAIFFGTTVIGSAAPSTEQHAVNAIREEVLADVSDGHHPLPLVSGWMDGRDPMGFTPGYQIRQVQSGRYFLPWMTLYQAPSLVPDDQQSQREADATASYYTPTVKYLAQHNLPVCITTSEWEVLMSKLMGLHESGKQIPLSPYSPDGIWYLVGQKWARHTSLRRMEAEYPNPPLVLVVADSEYPRKSPADLDVAITGRVTPELMDQRRSVGDAWVEKYRALLRGFREGLEADGWRKNLVIVGYDQFTPPSLGRWPGWLDYSLYVPGRIEPWPDAWDGASVSYYLHDYLADSDFTVWSPELEAMNWVSELDQLYRRRPAYWFELSTWDGQQRGQASDKALFYKKIGQQFSAARYGGMVQFGMWLVRPRVVREFRNPSDDLAHFDVYMQSLLAAAARVHDDETLREFWRNGRLLENGAGSHPYQQSVPAELKEMPRWYLLDTPSNPHRPWGLQTQLQVFSLALELGTAPHRQWLVYAFSPIMNDTKAQVQIPGGPVVAIDASVSGAFTRVSEDSRTQIVVGTMH